MDFNACLRLGQGLHGLKKMHDPLPPLLTFVRGHQLLHLGAQVNAVYVPPKGAAEGASPKVSRGARRHGTISAAGEDLHT